MTSLLKLSKPLKRPLKVCSAYNGAERSWSRGGASNSRPADYESAALPLSYPGTIKQKDSSGKGAKGSSDGTKFL